MTRNRSENGDKINKVCSVGGMMLAGGNRNNRKSHLSLYHFVPHKSPASALTVDALSA
jgi:hypothetical protein